MKVAIFTDTFIPQVNGVARTVGRLAEALAVRDISCLVLSPDTGLQGEYPFAFNFSPGLELPVYHECKLALPSYSGICKLMEQFRPDIIHLVTEFSMGLCGLKYASANRVPAVGSYHTNFPEYLAYYRLAFLTNWVWKYMRWFHNQCVTNYCPSEATLKKLEKKGIRNLDIWGRGIDTELFNPRKRDFLYRERVGAGDKILLLYVGRVAPEKDLDILMEALRMLNAGNRKVHLVVTGDGPQADALKREAPPNVTFTGYLHGQALAVVYASCDIFVFPSTTETYGNVVLEAMASGLPVVGAYAGGVKENLMHRFNGLTCRPRNAGDMAGAVREMIDNEGLRSALASRARSYTLTKSWDNVFNKLIEGYSRALAGGNKLISA